MAKPEDKPYAINNAFAQYGSLAHSILERYAKGGLEVYELCDAFRSEFCDEVTMDFPPIGKGDLRESYFNSAIEFFTNFDGYDDYEILAAEDEFIENINNDYNLKGYIDLLVRDKSDGKLMIIDHKSKSSFKSKLEKKQYARQLYLYCLRVYRKYGEYPKQMIFNMFRKQQDVVIDFDMAEYNDTLRWMNDTVYEIRKCYQYPPNYDDFACKYLCDFRESCPAIMDRGEQE